MTPFIFSYDDYLKVISDRFISILWLDVLSIQSKASMKNLFQPSKE